MKPQTYRKKPAALEAMQFDGTEASASAIAQWANAGDAIEFGADPTVTYITNDAAPGQALDMLVWTGHGNAEVNEGDWVIKGVAGEFYPCKPDIFAEIYEKV